MKRILILLLLTFSFPVLAQDKIPLSSLQQFNVELDILTKEKENLTHLEKKIDLQILRYYRYNILNTKPQELSVYTSNLPLKNDKLDVEIKGELDKIELDLNKYNIPNEIYKDDKIVASLTIDQIINYVSYDYVHIISLCSPKISNAITTTEGFYTHNVKYAHDKNFKGQGIKVGVLSDSSNYLSTVQASGNLPPSITVLNAGNGTGEGTAMLEIVYKTAPMAQLYFATAFISESSFATYIRQLRDLGCKVIVDDVMYANESPFQDGIIAQAVADVVSTGVSYFSSAGNSGNAQTATTGTWEGNYRSVGANPGTIITFYGSQSNQYTPTAFPFPYAHMFTDYTYANMILQNPVWLSLFWADPLGQSNNDYDIFIVDAYGHILASSESPQTGSQNPWEFISVGNSGKNYQHSYIVIVNFQNRAQPRFLHLDAARGKLQYTTSGTTYGHSVVEGAYCVAAINAKKRTTSFTNREPLETFSSDGPRRMFFAANGTPYTPNNYLSTGGIVRKKPDIAAADGVLTNTPGFNPFYGTSAAAPQAAAMTAVLLSANPTLTSAQIRTALTTNNLNRVNTWNPMYGYGIIMMDRMLQTIGQ